MTTRTFFSGAEWRGCGRGLMIGIAVWLAIGGSQAGQAREVTASRGEITLPTYPWSAVKHPYFRGTDRVNIYPYPMLDFLSRDRTDRTYQTVNLENEYLRITFLPELGGKIHEVIDKTTGKPMFYVNHVIKPALIGQAGAWTSGGVEWNTGPQGHTVGCMQPINVVILPREKDGSLSVAIGETERVYGTKWTVVVTLRPGRSFIEERIRIYNPTEVIRPYYFWNCTAVPNTKGFRFIYPMTLGTDHGAEQFFQWPLNEGKDLTCGTNYQDASSIFAWHCDQDFFGSYNDDLDRGVVAYANHHQLPGKKAWTWGWGSYGTMHQMDLTDDDGPYNEVQTGPLLTQGEVGRLDPCEAVEWQEWWYPIHGLGGFTFANKEVAVQAERAGTQLTLRVLGSAVWRNVSARLWAPDTRVQPSQTTFDLSPRTPSVVRFDLDEPLAQAPRLFVVLTQGGVRLAEFAVPLSLPRREPPARPPAPQTAAELSQAGWDSFLFARYPEAEDRFRKALAADPKSASAHTGLALLDLDPDPASAAAEARAALETAPSSGLASYALAVAADRLHDPVTALDAAWQAARDPAMAVAARALVAKLQLQVADYPAVMGILESPGPWQTDPLCRNRLAYACLNTGQTARAVQLARENLAVDPLDSFALSILWLANAKGGEPALRRLLQGDPPALLELAANYAAIVADDWAPVHRLFEAFYLKGALPRDPIASYWAAYGLARKADFAGLADLEHTLRSAPADGSFPRRIETVAILQDAVERNPKDGRAALYLGDLYFQLGRSAEARAQWQQAVALGAEPVLACRALGMSAKTLDNDLSTARQWLEKASGADPQDAIVARDLATVLYALADQAGSDAAKRALIVEARDRLQAAFEAGRGRSDFVALLARAHSRLGNPAETARLLGSVRITIWEGAREAHDLYEEAHLALGDAELSAGRPAEALAEYDRALEYPANLATGRLETTREAHLHFRRGNALQALGRTADAQTAWRQAADEPESDDARKREARVQAREALDKIAK